MHPLIRDLAYILNYYNYQYSIHKNTIYINEDWIKVDKGNYLHWSLCSVLDNVYVKNLLWSYFEFKYVE